MAATTPQQQQQQQYPSQQPPQQQPPPAQPQQPTTAAQKLAQVNEQTWLSMGNLAELMSDYDKATSCYESALRHNPYSIAALTQIASLCRGREQFGRAVEYFKRILAIQENNGETWAALGHCYLMMDNLQDAYHAYQQALYHLSNPKDPKLWYGIGILYDRYGSLEHAEEAFSAVMKMDPKFEKANEIYFRLGIIYKQQQKFDLSLQCFRYILHSPPRPLTEPDIWFQTGHVYEQQKEYELAKEAYERVLAENPDHAKVLQQLGWLYHQQNTSFCNQNLAIQYLTRSLKSDSNDAQSWYLLGRCYMAEQNYNKAYEAYQQAVYRDARNPTFWCSIGVLYYQINQYRDALDAYSRAIRLNPYISEVWYDLGTLYESCNNQVQDALDAYQRAADLDPTNPHIKQRLELLRKSQSVQSSQIAGSAPAPRDVSNPNQYQNGPGSQPLNGVPFNQPGSGTALSSMSAYNTSVGGSRAPEDRPSTPMLPPNSHETNNGQTRDLPALSGQPSIGGGHAPAPSERSQMNPIMAENEVSRDRRTPPPASLPYQQSPHVDQRAAAASHHPYAAKPVPPEETRPALSPKQHAPDANRAPPHPLSTRHSWQQPTASPQHPHASPRPETTASPRNPPVAPPHHPAEGPASAQKSPVAYEGNDPAHAHYGARPAEPAAYPRPEYPPESAKQQQLPPMKSEEPMATEQIRPPSAERAPVPAPATAATAAPVPASEAQVEKPAPAEKPAPTEEPPQPSKPQEDARISTAPKDTAAPESNAEVPAENAATKEEPSSATQVPSATQTSASTRKIDEDYDESAASTLLSMGNAAQNQETQKRTYPGEDNESSQESKRPRKNESYKEQPKSPKQELKQEPKDEAVPMEGQEQTSTSKPVTPPAAQQQEESEKPSEQQEQQNQQQQGESMETEPASEEKKETSAAPVDDGKEEGEVSEKDH